MIDTKVMLLEMKLDQSNRTVEGLLALMAMVMTIVLVCTFSKPQ